MTLDEFLAGVDAEAINNSLKKCKRSSILGEERVMNCGAKAICIAYRGSHDIDVQFENGFIVRHSRKDLFLSGKISAYGYTALREKFVGTRVEMNCGMSAVCIAYRRSDDIDIQFEDGVVVSSVRRDSFLSGKTMHPNISLRSYESSKYSILGSRKLMNCGRYCTVVRDCGAMDIDVQFDDGVVVTNRRRDHFEKCAILHPYVETLYGSSDSMAQRVLYYYIKKCYPNAEYCVRPMFLATGNGNGRFELDIFIPDIGVAIEFDGAVPGHFDIERCRVKRDCIEKAIEVKKLFVVRDTDKRIVVLDSPKTVNIHLSWTHSDLRYYDVYCAAKIILEDLGNDVSSLEWDGSVLPSLYDFGVAWISE